MKAILLCLTMFVESVFAQDQSKFYGFGQVKADLTGFTVTKVRVGYKGASEETRFFKVHYDLYADFTSDGKPELGFASIVVTPRAHNLPTILIGRWLDPVTYQFPAPFAIPVINYPVAGLFNKAMDTGVFLQKEGKRGWAMVGYTNGNGKLKDDNKSRDFSCRVNPNLPFGFSVSVVYRNGRQLDGNRVIRGADLSWKKGRVWFNGGQNVLDQVDKKTGRWAWGTLEITKQFQLVGMVESLRVNNDETTYGWAAGLNYRPAEKTVFRVNTFQSPETEIFGWAVLAQRIF